MRTTMAWLAAARCLMLSLSLLGPGSAAARRTHPEAVRHFDAGKRAYRVGDFPRAITEWRAAYDLDPKPSILFSLAQAHRQLGEVDKARYLYKQYLLEAAPDSPYRTVADERLAELERAAESTARDQATAAAPAPLPPPAPRTPVVAVPSTQSATVIAATTAPTLSKDRPPRRNRWLAVGLGVGGSIVVAGIAVGLGVGLSRPEEPTALLGTYEPVLP